MARREINTTFSLVEIVEFEIHIVKKKIRHKNRKKIKKNERINMDCFLILSFLWSTLSEDLVTHDSDSN